MPSPSDIDSAHEPSNKTSSEKRMVVGSGRRKRPAVPFQERKRAKKACESCRRNKLKCDGQNPCGRCSRAQRLCGYSDHESPSRLASEPQRPNHPSKKEQDIAEKLHNLEEIFEKLHPGVQFDDMQALRRKYASSNPCIQHHSTRWPKPPPINISPSYNENEDDRSDPMQGEVLGKTPIPTASITVFNQGKTHFEGHSSCWTFFKSARQVVTGNDDCDGTDGDDQDQGNSSSVYQESHDEVALYEFPTIQYSLDLKTAVLAALPPRDVVDFLVTTFFRSAQANQFYIHPEIFSRRLNALYNGTAEFDMQKASESKRSSDFICLMFMVFAIGSQFAEVETHEVNVADNNQPPILSLADAGSLALDFSRLAIPKPSQSPGWRFYEVSRRLLPDVVVSSSMTSVQVCVLQGIFLPSTESRDAGYNLLGLALRMAVNMGMHRTFGADSLHPHVRELRNRLWWSVYVAERIFSVEMGRPLAINDAEIDAPFPVEMPEWGDVSGKASINVDGLVAMIKLCRLQGKIVDSVYCKPASGEGTIITPEVFERLQNEIDQSRKDLPKRLRSFPGRNTPRSVAHIFMSYEQATVLLTRSCLNYAAAAKHTNQMLSDEARLFVRHQAQNCVNSAVATIQTMFSLRSRSLLCRFSFHDSLYCTAALYVLMLGKSLNWLPKSVTKEPIHQGIFVLLDLAKGSEIAADALRYIVRCLQKDNLDPSSPTDGGIGPEARHERGRRAWKAWITKSSHGASAPNDTSSRNSSSMLNSHAHDVTSPPSFINGHFHGPWMCDLPPFWMLENSNCGFFGRDLIVDPDMPGPGDNSFL